MESRVQFLVILSVICCALNPCLSRSQSDADWDWVNKHFSAVLDEFLPLPTDFRVLVAFRSHRDLYTDVLEYSFVIWGPRPGSSEAGSEATVRMADRVSLYDQMMALHRKDPSASIEKVKAELKVKEWRLPEKSCPAIAKEVEKFWGIQFRSPRNDLIILHPLIYEFRTVANTGRMKLELYDHSHPLPRWATQARAAFEACIASQKSSK